VIYAKKYADPTTCDTDTAEEAQDTLRKVRNAMRSDKPLFPDDNDPDRKPDVDEAITAKVTGEKCHGVLTLLEVAQIELYLVRQWVWWAGHALERDAPSTATRRQSRRSPAAGAQRIVPRLPWARRRGSLRWCDGRRQPTHPNA